MAYETKELKMSDGNVNVIHCWIPEKPDAAVVLSHGMQEHALRYARLADYLAKSNIALIAEDHRGHGKTAQKAEKDGTGRLSFLAEKDGFNRVAKDIHEVILHTRSRFPGKHVYLLGHSFGSFIAQCIAEDYGDSVDKVVLCGTAGPRGAMIAMANLIGSIVKAFRGNKAISKFMNNLTFGPYNAKIQQPRTAFDWLSRDEKEVDLYIKDPLCGNPATVGFLCDLYSGLRQIHKKAAIERIPKELPIFLIAGTADPVGSYGKTVKSLYDCYKKAGIKDVEIKLYEGARHELFNETNRDEVMKDFVEFLLR